MFGSQRDPSKKEFSISQFQPRVIDESKVRYSGRLKFFDKKKHYGFLVLDKDNSDCFVFLIFLILGPRR